MAATNAKMAVNTGMELTVPTDQLREDQTLSMDFGSSCAKFVYAVKDNNNPKFSTLKIDSFPRENIEDIMTFIKEHVKRESTEGGATPTVTLDATGHGSLQVMKRLETELGIKLNLVGEVDLMFRALLWMLKHIPLKDMVYPPMLDAMADPIENVQDQLKLMKEATQEHLLENMQLPDFSKLENMLERMGRPGKDTGSASAVDSLDSVFPGMLGVCGSAHGFLKFNESGTYMPQDMMNSAGKAIYGKGKAFLHVKSFEEFLELAKRGDNRKVDIYASECTEGYEGQEGAGQYAKAHLIKHDSLLFNFGKAANQEPDHAYDRADLARAMLLENLLLFVQSMTTNAQYAKARHVYVCGTLPTNELVRGYLTTEITRRNLIATLLNPQYEEVKVHFLKHGAYLGAIGNLLKTSTK